MNYNPFIIKSEYILSIIVKKRGKEMQYIAWKKLDKNKMNILIEKEMQKGNEMQKLCTSLMSLRRDSNWTANSELTLFEDS